MSIGSQVEDAARKLSERRYEDAVVAVSVAFSATARREYPSHQDKQACHAFIEANLSIISKIGWVAFGMAGSLSFIYRSLDPDPRRAGMRVRTTAEMLYDVVRCTAVHEARLPENLHFTREPVIQTGDDGELILPIDVIFGLLIAVVASPKNAGERVTDDLTFQFDGKRTQINDLWGKPDVVRGMLGLT